MSANQCPDADHLDDFLFGRVDESSAESLGEHVRICADCQTKLDACNGGEDTMVAALKRGADGSKFDREPELQQALRQLNELLPRYEGGALDSLDRSNLGQGILGQGILGQGNSEYGNSELYGADEAHLGQYHLLELLGKGGMGAVFKAEHTRLEMIVAVKVLSERLIADSRAVKRFVREIKAVGKVNHPNVVRATDAGEHKGRHYLVMEFVDGRDLSQIIEAQGRLKIQDACEAIRQAAIGVSHAHGLGLIHRDLKPSNLMVTHDGQVKVLDLGLARLLSTDVSDGGLTDEFQIMGTADYMAPEQALGAKEVDQRVDIYSLGCTLYTLLCGSPPFSGPEYDHPLKKIVGHGRDEPTPVNRHRPEVPCELSALVDETLAKSPGERVDSMARLAELLGAFVGGADLAALLPAERTALPAERMALPAERMALPAELMALPAELMALPAERTKGAMGDTNDMGSVVAMADTVTTDAESLWLSDRRYLFGAGAGIGVVLLTASAFVVHRWQTDSKIDGKASVLAQGEDRDKIASASSQSALAKPQLAKAPFDSKQAAAHQEAWANQLGSEVVTTNSLGMKMRLIPPGEFPMGTSQLEIERIVATSIDQVVRDQMRYEGPQRQVTITTPFLMSTSEVTCGQFRVFMEESDYTTDAETDGLGGWGYENGQIVRHPKFNWSHLGFEQTDDHPVVNVSWNDANAFCDWLSRKEGVTYRLPTEAQWEYACRAGTVGPFSFRDAALELHAWYRDSESPIPPADAIGTRVVGQKRGNAFGLVDVHGSVWEWCSDWLSFYKSDPDVDPLGPAEGVHRVIRGGSWYKTPVECRSAYRSMAGQHIRFSDLGFRVTADPSR